MQPLYGYSSQDQSYLVHDYPYGSARCQIRFWLECDEKRGFRFCSQTLHPRKLIWNNPKKSTYSKLAGCMYLDEKGHCVWSGLSEYSEGDAVLQFIRNFPEAELRFVRNFVGLKIHYLQKLISGEFYHTIAGVKKTISEEDKERYKRDLAAWEKCRDV